MTSTGWDLCGRVALVTGASGGLGAHFAEVLAAAGAHVILAARRLDQLEVQAARISERNGRCSILALDVSHAASIAEIAPTLATVDILVNHAGIVRSEVRRVGKECISTFRSWWSPSN